MNKRFLTINGRENLLKIQNACVFYQHKVGKIQINPITLNKYAQNATATAFLLFHKNLEVLTDSHFNKKLPHLAYQCVRPICVFGSKNVKLLTSSVNLIALIALIFI